MEKSQMLFYSLLTQKVKDMFSNKNIIPYIIKKELTNNALIPLTQSADRSGFLIYQSDNRITCLSES